MPKPLVPEADFIRLFEEIGPTALSERINCTLSKIYVRRRSIERRIGRLLKSPNAPHHGLPVDFVPTQHPGRIGLQVRNGVVLVGSDCHYWPGPPSTAHRAFVKFVKDLKPAAVILNGDVNDFCQISRHPPIGWTKLPTVEEELRAAKERTDEIASATFRARKIWGLGNHDGRFETRLATHAREYAKVHGTSLQDHFPDWEACWSVWINDDVVVKHRFKGGIHAPHNNAMWAGKTIITGHLHSAKVTPLTDYNGTRYGVDTGCIADPSHRAFLDYTEDNPKNWRSAFCVLTFKDGVLLWPELVVVFDDKSVQWRGEVIKV